MRNATVQDTNSHQSQSRVGFREWSNHLVLKPSVGVGVFIFALALTPLIILKEQPATLSITDGALLVSLIAAIVGSRWLAIHIGSSVTIYLASIPLFALCFLFSPPLAMIAAGAGLAIREGSTCRRCGTTPVDVAIQSGRWMLLSFAVSSVVHIWPLQYALISGSLAAMLMWLGDVVSSPLLFAPIEISSVFPMIRRVAGQTYAGEMVQYLVALFSILLLRNGVEWTAIMYLPIIVMIIGLLYLYLKSVSEMQREPSLVDIDTPLNEDDSSNVWL